MDKAQQPIHFTLPALLLLLLFFINTASACHSGGASGDTLRNQNNFHQTWLNSEVDSIVVVKHFRHMFVFNNHKLLKVYTVALGQSPVGPKHFQGDLKTPEGLYHITNKNAQSIAHKSLAISYPNDDDRKYARRFGKPTGGDVMIHGTMNGDENNEDAYINTDWTWGCIAVTNKEVDELFKFVKIGAPIYILP